MAKTAQFIAPKLTILPNIILEQAALPVLVANSLIATIHNICQ